MMLAVFVIMFVHAFYNFAAAAEMVPTFLQQGQDAEQSLGGAFQKIFDYFLYIAIGIGAIGVVWGFIELNGIIGKKEAAAEKIKYGLITVASAAVLKGVIAYFANIA